MRVFGAKTCTGLRVSRPFGIYTAARAWTSGKRARRRRERRPVLCDGRPSERSDVPVALEPPAVRRPLFRLLNPCDRTTVRDGASTAGRQRETEQSVSAYPREAHGQCTKKTTNGHCSTRHRR